MRRAALICLLLAAALAGLAWWGLFTPDGHRKFAEMAELIPFTAGVMSAFLAMVAAISWGFSRLRHRRAGHPLTAGPGLAD